MNALNNIRDIIGSLTGIIVSLVALGVAAGVVFGGGVPFVGCGTLDPLATGLLPICIGEATKFSSFMSDLDKTYEVDIRFGLETDTGDIEGEIISKSINKAVKMLD